MQHVRGVGDGDEERVVGEEAHRQRRVAAREVLGQERGRCDVDLGLTELDERHLDLLGEKTGHLGTRDRPLLDEDLAESLARPALLRERELRALPR